jgi:hypothetical protein
MIDTNLNTILARQLEPPIRMLLTAIEVCPEDVWVQADDGPPVWQHILHATYYLQNWVRMPTIPFQPPAFVDRGAVDFTAASEPAISRETLQSYLQDTAENCRQLLKNTDNGLLFQEVEINGGSYALLDQILGQVRHLMYHVGCVSSILRCETGSPLVWIGYEKKQAE